LTGLAPEKYRETLRQSALSLRPLTALERGAVTGKRLRVVTARAGERFEELGARCGNVWSPTYTALVNGLNPDTVLDGGRLLKTAREERWEPKPLKDARGKPAPTPGQLSAAIP
jgi:predicted Zn-dependent protease